MDPRLNLQQDHYDRRMSRRVALVVLGIVFTAELGLFGSFAGAGMGNTPTFQSAKTHFRILLFAVVAQAYFVCSVIWIAYIQYTSTVPHPWDFIAPRMLQTSVFSSCFVAIGLVLIAEMVPQRMVILSMIFVAVGAVLITILPLVPQIFGNYHCKLFPAEPRVARIVPEEPGLNNGQVVIEVPDFPTSSGSSESPPSSVKSKDSACSKPVVELEPEKTLNTSQSFSRACSKPVVELLPEKTLTSTKSFQRASSIKLE